MQYKQEQYLKYDMNCYEFKDKVGVLANPNINISKSKLLI